MTRLHELTDAQWQRIAPLVPSSRQRGGRWRDHRQVVNGILWRLRTGAPWRDVPDRYGPWQTLHKRYHRWRLDGTWARIEAALEDDATGRAGGLIDEAIGRHGDGAIGAHVDEVIGEQDGEEAGAPVTSAGRRTVPARPKTVRPEIVPLRRWTDPEDEPVES